MKKTGAILLSILLAAGLCACTSANPLPQDSVIEQTENAASETKEETAASAENEKKDGEESADPAESPSSDSESTEPEQTESESAPSQLISAEKVEEEASPQTDTQTAEAQESASESTQTETAAENGQKGTAAPGATVTATQPVFIRSDPDVENSEIIGAVPGGAQVTVLSVTYGWYQINYNGVTGYSYGDFFE